MSYGEQVAPHLSICVPTYNRPSEFERMLSGIIKQIKDDSNIEIVVRDDSPNEKTKLIFYRLLEGRAIRHQYFSGSKIGLDAANLFLLEKATGDFIWWFSDDDEMLTGGISEVLSLIFKFANLNLIWANFHFEKIGNLAVDRPSGFFKNGSEPLEVLGTNIGLLSTYILRRSVALQGLDIARKFVVGFSFASTSVVFYVLTLPGEFYFMRGPYILCHPTTPEEIKKIMNRSGKIENVAFNSYGVDFYNILMEFKGKFDQRSIRRLLTVNFASLWRGMLVGWVGGWDTPNGKLWKMFRLYWSFPEFWIALPLFLMPLWLNRFLYKIYKFFFKNRRFVFGKKSDKI